MTRPAISVGCAGFPVGAAEYSSQLDFVEIQETFLEPPDPGEAPSWSHGVAGELVTSLVAWQVITHPRSTGEYRRMRTEIPDHAAVGHFARSRWTDEAWQRMDALARTVRAPVIVFRTPPSFRRTQQNATALENFVAHAQRPGLSFAWDWGASWSAEHALEFCERTGMIPVVDPTAQRIPEGDVYLRVLGGRSGRTAPTEAALEKLAESVRARTGHIVFANVTAWEDARRLAKLL